MIRASLSPIKNRCSGNNDRRRSSTKGRNTYVSANLTVFKSVLNPEAKAFVPVKQQSSHLLAPIGWYFEPLIGVLIPRGTQVKFWDYFINPATGLLVPCAIALQPIGYPDNMPRYGTTDPFYYAAGFAAHVAISIDIKYYHYYCTYYT
jgi:hypothetical protein